MLRQFVEHGRNAHWIEPDVRVLAAVRVAVIVTRVTIIVISVMIVIIILIGVMIVVVVVIGVVVIVIGVMILMVVVIGVMIVVVIVFISMARGESNQIGMFRDPQHRRPGIFNRRKRVLQLKLQKQSVGNHKVGVLHALPVTERRFESVGVATDGDDRPNIGNSTTGHIGYYVCPDGGRHLDAGNVRLRCHRRLRIGGVPASGSDQCQHREDHCRRKQVPARREWSRVFGRGSSGTHEDGSPC